MTPLGQPIGGHDGATLVIHATKPLSAEALSTREVSDIYVPLSEYTVRTDVASITVLGMFGEIERGGLDDSEDSEDSGELNPDATLCKGDNTLTVSAGRYDVEAMGESDCRDRR